MSESLSVRAVNAEWKRLIAGPAGVCALIYLIIYDTKTDPTGKMHRRVGQET